jgi:hypothetical protein
LPANLILVQKTAVFWSTFVSCNCLLSTQLKVLEFSVCITQNILAEDDAKTLLCDKHQANTTTPLAVQQ